MDNQVIVADFLVALAENDLETFTLLYEEHLEGWQDKEKNEDEKWIFTEVVNLLYHYAQFGEIDEAFVNAACELLYANKSKEERDFRKQDIMYGYWMEQGDDAKIAAFVERNWTLPADLERALNIRKLSFYVKNRNIAGIKEVRPKIKG